MSRIKTPSLIEKFESRRCPLASLVEKYVLHVTASVCDMTVYQVTLFQVFLFLAHSQMVFIYLLPVGNADAITPSQTTSIAIV